MTSYKQEFWDRITKFELENSLKVSFWNIGNWNTQVLEFNSTSPRVLIFIPGNPGIALYYKEFLGTIYKETNINVYSASYPSHFPHDDVPLNLDQQVEHKVMFVDAVVKKYPKDTEFYVAGHSLGCFMILGILRQRPNLFKRVFGLFPAMHSIAKTPNGQRMNGTVFHSRFLPIAQFIVSTVCRFIPKPILSQIVTLVSPQSPEILKVTMDHLADDKGNAIRACLYLSRCEMDQILDLDHELMSNSQHKWLIYFGTDDGWAPLHHYHLMKDKYPAVESILCQEGIGHAFVMYHSKTMAYKMIEWLRRDQAANSE